MRICTMTDLYMVIYDELQFKTEKQKLLTYTFKYYYCCFRYQFVYVFQQVCLLFSLLSLFPLKAQQNYFFICFTLLPFAIHISSTK